MMRNVITVLSNNADEFACVACVDRLNGCCEGLRSKGYCRYKCMCYGRYKCMVGISVCVIVDMSV